jgi:hypothetical protein
MPLTSSNSPKREDECDGSRSSSRLVLFSLLLGGCVHSAEPRGDVEEGPCRVDADCAQGQRCLHDRAHLRSSSGDITGDLVTYFCATPPEARDGG